MFSILYKLLFAGALFGTFYYVFYKHKKDEASPTEQYNAAGFDKYGIDKYGRDMEGRDYQGFDMNGYDASGYDINGYDIYGFNEQGLDASGHSMYDSSDSW